MEKPGRVVFQRKGENVDVEGFKFKLNPQFSALGMLGSIACKINEGDFVDPPFIIGKDGKKRPLYINFNAGCGIKEIIDYRYLVDVHAAEEFRWKVAQELELEHLPRFMKAFDALAAVRTAHVKVKERDGYEYRKYTATKRPGRKDYGIYYDWLKTKPKKMRNVKIGKTYEAEEDKLETCNARLATWNEILHRALMSTLPPEERYSRYLGMNPGITIFKINGRDYLYERTRKGLVRLAFPGPYDKDVVRTKDLDKELTNVAKNTKAQK